MSLRTLKCPTCKFLRIMTFKIIVQCLENFQFQQKGMYFSIIFLLFNKKIIMLFVVFFFSTQCSCYSHANYFGKMSEFDRHYLKLFFFQTHFQQYVLKIKYFARKLNFFPYFLTAFSSKNYNSKYHF